MIPAVQGKAIVITDIFVSASDNSVEPQVWLYDGDLKFFIWFPEKTTTSMNLSGPIILDGGNDFKIGSNTHDTDYSVFATYYYI